MRQAEEGVEGEGALFPLCIENPIHQQSCHRVDVIADPGRVNAPPRTS